MSLPFIGEIRMFAGNFAPAGWMFCDGQIMPIAENETLFNLIGTTYGGDGQETFALPDFRGRLPVHAGNGFILAQKGGVEHVVLTSQQIPAHTHAARCKTGTNTGNAATPGGNVWADQAAAGVYANQPPTNAMSAGAVSPVGGSQPHENMMPFLAIRFIISLFGIFPSQT
jgi:microcystin-dependent protein